MSIIGHGDIASVLPNRDDLLFFASGVSNSQETDEKEYQREINLLMKQDRNSHLVYFSSIAVFNASTRYFRHKREMEELVRENFKKYTILRLGNILWGSNPYTIINFIKNQIERGEKIEIRNEYKYVVDKNEFLYWISLIPPWSCEMTIPGKRMKVRDLVKEYVL